MGYVEMYRTEKKNRKSEQSDLQKHSWTKETHSVKIAITCEKYKILLGKYIKKDFPSWMSISDW
jgi:hypothetical protein